MRVTLKEIANEAGVSIYTVSRVLNGKNKEAYQPAAERAQRIRQVAQRMGFVPNASARSMQRSGTKIIGLLVPEIPATSLVDYETILGVNEGLEAEGYVLALTRSSDVVDESPEQDAQAVKPRVKRGESDPEQQSAAPLHPSRVFQERMLDGMVVLGPIPEAMCRLVERITPATLWMDTNVLRPTNCLRRDETHVGRLVAKQLIARGYRRLVFVTPSYQGSVPHFSFDDRPNAAAAVAREAGVAFEQRSIDLNDGMCEDIVGALGDTLRPDVALVAATDRTALPLLVQMAQRGLRPGVDCGIAACDRTNHTQTHWPGLSTVNVQRYHLGQQAAAMMMQILESPTHTCPSDSVCWSWHEGDTAPGPGRR